MTIATLSRAKMKKNTMPKAQQRRRARLKQEIKSTTQKSLKYTSLRENGLMHILKNEYSFSYKLGDINYMTASEDGKESIIIRYFNALNALDSNNHLQLTIVNRRTEQKKLDGLLYENKEDGLDWARHELNEMTKENFKNGKNNFVVDKYLTLSAKAADPDLAQRNLRDVHSVMTRELNAIRVPLTQLDGEDRMNLMQSLVNQDFNETAYTYNDLKLLGGSSKDVIAPNKITWGKNYYRVDDRIQTVLFARQFPEEIEDDLIRDLTESGLELVINLHASPLLAEEASKMVRNRLTAINSDIMDAQIKATRAGYSPDLIPEKLKENKESADELKTSMKKYNEKLFSSTITVRLIADSLEERKLQIQKIRSIGNQHGIRFGETVLYQEDAFNSVLPIGKNYLDVEENFTQNLITSNLAVTSPFTTVDLQHQSGRWYGVNKISNNAILINRKDKSISTPSGIICGISGKGKGVSAKFEITTTRLLNPNDEFLILDPENEYSELGKLFNASQINLSPHTSDYINLMELAHMEKRGDAIKIKGNFLADVFGTLLDGEITKKHISIIDRVTRLLYDQFPDETPTLKEWYIILKEQPEEEAHDLALDLEFYIEGSANIFAHQTSVKESNFTIYNLKQLDYELKEFGIMIILDKIWNRVVENQAKGIRTWIYIDEMQLLLSNQYASKFFFELWSRVRKYGAIPTGITQNIGSLLATLDGRRIISNSQFGIFLSQSKDDITELSKVLELSDEQKDYITEQAAGNGLLRAGRTIVPFENIIPEHTKLYKILTTDVGVGA